jgi:hypothetical protein
MSKSGVPKCTRCVLILSDGSLGETLDIAPTMKNITRNGERYFRTDRSYRECEDGQFAMAYLSANWKPEHMRTPDP